MPNQTVETDLVFSASLRKPSHSPHRYTTGENMRFTKFVDFSQEIEIDISSDELFIELDADQESTPAVLRCMNDVATFMKGIPASYIYIVRQRSIVIILLLSLVLMATGSIFNFTLAEYSAIINKNRHLVDVLFKEASVISKTDSVHLAAGIASRAGQRQKTSSTLAVSTQAKDVDPSVSEERQPGSRSFKNSIGMLFIEIAAGDFKMGSNRGNADESPVHRVTISKPFYMQATEVTIGQYLIYLNITGDDTGVNIGYPDCPVERYDGGFEMRSGSGSFWGDMDQPMIDISWEGAFRFAKWLGKIEGRNYRLPSEAEWEYACRAGTNYEYSFDGGAGRLEAYGWYNKNSGGKTHPVGRKLPNEWGLYDMHGNACEWVYDYYGEYTDRYVKDPEGPSSGVYRVARGGAWYYSARFLRSAYRINYDPTNTCDGIGFRLSLDK